MKISSSQPRHSDLFRQVLNVDWHLVAYRAKSHPHEARYEDEYRRTPLHLACLPADVPYHVISCLLEAFPQATMKRNKWGATPLHCASLYSDSEVVRKLLEANIDAIYVKNDDGYTPLLYMTKWFEFNFRRGLATLSKNSQRCFPSTVQSITMHQDPELDRLWKNACLLTSASYHGSIQRAKKSSSLHHFAGISWCPSFLFDFALTVQKQDLYEQDLEGNLPLHVALSSSSYSEVESKKRGNTEKSAIEKLVEANPLAARVVNYEGDLPLHLAIRTRKRSGDVLKVFEAFPGAATVIDCKSRLYPFMSVAEGENFCLDVTFVLLCACPELERLTGFMSKEECKKRN